MTSKKTIEAKGSDVDSAIAKGLAELGLSREAVAVEIIDEGSRGLFGLGGRPAVVRLTANVAPETIAPPVVTRPAPPPPVAPPPVITPAPRPAPAAKPAAAAAPRPPRQHQDETEEESDVLTEEELTEEGETALEVIGTLLSHLSIQAETDLIVSEPDDLTGRRINTINITGNDLGVLIGQRGETLDAIQYLSRLMISHRLQRKATFTIDIESYRQRRKEALARLAERMAQKVTKQRRPVTLEPMPPHERRAVHMALRNFRGVYTQSTGTGDRRRVRIFPER